MKRVYRDLVFAAMCLALAMVLPFFTGQIPEIGQALSPMHIPALLCGFICGPVWGAVVGGAAPLLRSAVFGMPPFPTAALPMAFELAAYGLSSGLLYRILPKKIPFIYVSLISSMIFGRIVWGIASWLIVTATAGTFTLAAFVSGAVTGAVPGIICHIVLVPLIVLGLRRAKLISDK